MIRRQRPCHSPKEGVSDLKNQNAVEILKLCRMYLMAMHRRCTEYKYNIHDERARLDILAPADLRLPHRAYKAGRRVPLSTRILLSRKSLMNNNTAVCPLQTSDECQRISHCTSHRHRSSIPSQAHRIPSRSNGQALRRSHYNGAMHR